MLTERTLSEYERNRRLIADIVSTLIESRPNSREQVLKDTLVSDPYDFFEAINMADRGYRIHRPLRIIDFLADYFSGDKLNWSEIHKLKVLEIGGGRGDLFNNLAPSKIRPVYPFLSAILTALGANCTNIDTGQSPEELPQQYQHLNLNIVTELFIPEQTTLQSMGPFDVITCLGFCDTDNPDPELVEYAGRYQKSIDDVYFAVSSLAKNKLASGGVLIIDGFEKGEVWKVNKEKKLKFVGACIEVGRVY